MIKNAVVSEREGNWNLLVATVKDSMSIFAKCDCISFLCYGSWYLEQIKDLEFTHPELYQHISKGEWVVCDHPGWFSECQRVQEVNKPLESHVMLVLW